MNPHKNYWGHHILLVLVYQKLIKITFLYARKILSNIPFHSLYINNIESFTIVYMNPQSHFQEFAAEYIENPYVTFA